MYTRFLDWGTPKSLLLRHCHSTPYPSLSSVLGSPQRPPSRHEITGYIFKQQIRRLPLASARRASSKEESAARISELFDPAMLKVWQGKSAAGSWKSGIVPGSWLGIFNEPLSLRVKQGVVTAVGVFVDFAVSYAFKSSGTGQSLAETADAGEHIYELDQGHNSRWGCLPDLRRCLIGAPHQKQKQPVIGCTKQDFFTVHNV